MSQRVSIPLLDFLVERGEIRDYDTDGDSLRLFYVEGMRHVKEGIVVSKYSLLDALVREGIIGAYELEKDMTTFVRGMPEDYDVTWSVTLDGFGEVIV